MTEFEGPAPDTVVNQATPEQAQDAEPNPTGAPSTDSQEKSDGASEETASTGPARAKQADEAESKGYVGGRGEAMSAYRNG